MEDELLAQLEDLAQKTDVLTHWADEMYEYVKAVPQSELSCFSIGSEADLSHQNPFLIRPSLKSGRVNSRSTLGGGNTQTWKPSTML
jgi:hypothetical protein